MPAQDQLVSGFQFVVEIDGQTIGSFRECSGLGSEHEVVEHRTVDQKGQELVIKLPGRLKWDNITLKRGMTSSMELWEWRQQVERGDVESARRTGSIVLLDEARQPLARWEFHGAWPVKLTVSFPQGEANGLMQEEVTLVPEDIRRVS